MLVEKVQRNRIFLTAVVVLGGWIADVMIVAGVATASPPRRRRKRETVVQSRAIPAMAFPFSYV